MTRRLLVLLATVVGSFAAAAGAVAFFADTEETYDVVRAGAPIPWLQMWSQSTDPANSPSTTLTYGTRNDQPGAAATGKIDGTTAATLAINLGDRSSGNVTWKKAPNGSSAQTIADVEHRFNRLFTVQVPANAPVPAGQKVTVALGQANAVPALSSGNLMFDAVQLASITSNANTELTSAFRGTGFATTMQLDPGDKRQVNVLMATFGQTDTQSDRVVTTAITVTVTTPDGDTLSSSVPVTVCNHVQQC